MKTYKAQEWDTDCECWQDMDEVVPSTDKYEVQQEARYYANKCAYRIKTRVVEVDM